MAEATRTPGWVGLTATAAETYVHFIADYDIQPSEKCGATARVRVSRNQKRVRTLASMRGPRTQVCGGQVRRVSRFFVLCVLVSMRV